MICRLSEKEFRALEAIGETILTKFVMNKKLYMAHDALGGKTASRYKGIND